MRINAHSCVSNLDNDRLITNHSCHRTAIQLLKNSGIPESELQAFSWHRSRESIADYCQTSNDQRITNTAMLIHKSLTGGFLDEKLDFDNESYEQNLTKVQLPTTNIQHSNITKEVPL
ncbi:hypothetical protein C2G38_2211676 [Gigaspora rosea]|uniref:Uncharacterized protein n=1 Tax=Gigaspora rosea TaxID=44941 RepID=A0A397UGT0_9GLOM|nr:hypothetical protein C2G38_2211676 [Gigaspora rosea]